MLFTTLHLFGVILGAGGAFASDWIFLSSVRDGRISHTEAKFIRLGSRMVWTGLAILLISGLALFLRDPAAYLASAKFLSKMTVVGVIILNGLLFHLSHLPRIRRHAGSHFPSSDEFMRRRSLLVASGAVSVTSWATAVILGAWRGIPFSYPEIMSGYLALVLLAILVALLLPHHFVPSK